jgi:superfamily II DNA or RNA helicase
MSFVNIDDVRRRIEEQRDRKLNEEQRRAIRSILENPLLEDGFLLPIVDGPPGTGKTTVGVYACVHGILEGIMRAVLYISLRQTLLHNKRN